jgi:hypothetical protein
VKVFLLMGERRGAPDERVPDTEEALCVHATREGAEAEMLRFQAKNDEDGYGFTGFRIEERQVLP